MTGAILLSIVVGLLVWWWLVHDESPAPGPRACSTHPESTATPELRWAVTRYDKARGLQGELQQKGVTPAGRVEWRAVPQVPV